MLCKSNIRLQLNLFTLLLALIHNGSTLPPFIIKQHDGREILYKVASKGNHPKPFSLLCEAAGDPMPRYRWTKNGEHFNLTEYGNRIIMNSPNGTLTFLVPKDEDEGIYQCFAKNKHGFATFSPLIVRKSYLEGFKDDSIQVVEAVAGRPLKLECKAPNAYPPASVYWMIQTRGSGEIQSIDDARKTVDPDGNLWFISVSDDDVLKSGEYYTCAASSRFRNEYKLGIRVQLKVIHANNEKEEKITPIVQYVSAPSIVSLRGQRTELFCIYGGSDPLHTRVIWKINGTTINYDKRIKERNFGKSLLIRDTRILDRGLYSCEIISDSKETANQSSLINVDVLAEPYFISYPQSIVAIENQTKVVEFTCEVRGLPEPTIIWTYNGRVLNITTSNDNDNELVTSTQSSEISRERLSIVKNKLTIKDLMKSDIGNYGCNATNNLGFAYRDFYLDIVKPQTFS
ncbi:hypothetical protein PVAND_012322 [Polypedilum vanderplanki]|uniref:Ig-like domain-containing protein n=1 Tax=Polypedilum vanderplanki TaxID=319348 RepID=A0A9J6CM44_POLVA|nr:hypothetical protein PVAND_012322 [Polypedilum vanderplanki]